MSLDPSPQTFLAALAFVLALSPAPPADDVVFEARAGAKSTKTFEIETEYTTEEGLVAIGDMEHNAGEGMVRTRTLHLAVDDEVLAGGEGRPAKLRRQYRKIESETDVEGVPEGVAVRETGEAQSDLAGHAVEFTWDEEDGAYDASFVEDDDGDEAWLAELREDMDLRCLLPKGEVSEGDSWDVPLEDLGDLLAPGGRLWVESGVDDPRGGHQGGIAIVMPDATRILGWADATGDVTARYAGRKTVDDVEVGVIAVELDVETLHDIGDDLNRAGAARGMPEIEYDFAELERALRAKGELLWDLEAGRLHSFELEGDVKLVIDAEWEVDMGGGMALSLHQVLAGELRMKVSVD